MQYVNLRLICLTTIVFRIIILVGVPNSYAQLPTLGWAVSIGGPDYDEGTSIAVDDSGNVYNTGYFVGTVDFDPGPDTFNIISTGVSEIYISKMGSEGDFMWAVAIGGTGATYDLSLSIALADSGSVYTTGRFGSTGDFDPGPDTFNLTSVGANDIYISKFDTSGNFVWARSIGGTGYDQGNHIATDDSGYVYITGSFQGMVDFDPGLDTFNLTSVGTSDIYICKLDASGNFIWALALDGTGDGASLSIAIDDLGNIYTTGYFYNNADFDPGPGIFNLTSVGSSDIFICKLDRTGNFQWAGAMGDTWIDRGTSLTLDDSGNVYITGHFVGTVDFDPGPAILNITAGGFNDVFISKLDASGSLQWVRNMGGPGNANGYSISLDSLGNVYTSGYFTGTADFDPGPDTFNLNAGSKTSFISKLDAFGSFVWAVQTGGGGGPFSNSMALDNSGNIFTTGQFSGTADFDPGSGTFPLTCLDSTDIFILKLNQTCITSQTINPIACELYISPSGNYTWTSSGTYMDTIPNTPGCDSISITVNLIIANATFSSLTTASCASFMSPSGNYTWTNSGIYTDTLANAQGCDSIITIDLTVNLLPTVSISGLDSIYCSSDGSVTMSGSPAGGVFSGGTAVSGNQFLPSTGIGAYTVTYSFTDSLGCSNSVSNSTSVIQCAGIPTVDETLHLQIYPNPNSGEFIMKINNTQANKIEVIISNILGQIIFSERLAQFKGRCEHNFDLSNYAMGVYSVQILLNTEVITRKLIIE